jgi:hypothetical protein
VSKRTDTDSAAENPSNFWPTPASAVEPLVPELRQDLPAPPRAYFVEPCAGDGALVRALRLHGIACRVAFDTEPRDSIVRRGDASRVDWTVADGAPAIPVVTNPPWARHLLEPILVNIIGTRVIWLLLPLDYATNLWTNPYMRYVNRIVPLGRVSWKGNGRGGMENSAWFRFSPQVRSFITERKPK